MYSEIERYGNINKALNIEFSKIESPLRVMEDESTENFPLSYARIEKGNKFSQIYLAANEKLYLPDFWRNGVCLAHGKIDNIKELVNIIDFWLLKNISTKELSQRFPKVIPNEKAEAFDENKEVDYAWNSYLKDESFKELKEFIEIAKQDKVIGKLFPFTSLMRLCFSRCTGYPYTYDTPIVISIPYENGKYEVRFPENTTIGRGTAKEALEILKNNLPKDIKPAIKGTADDL